MRPTHLLAALESCFSRSFIAVWRVRLPQIPDAMVCPRWTSMIGPHRLKSNYGISPDVGPSVHHRSQIRPPMAVRSMGSTVEPRAPLPGSNPPSLIMDSCPSLISRPLRQARRPIALRHQPGDFSPCPTHENAWTQMNTVHGYQVMNSDFVLVPWLSKWYVTGASPHAGHEGRHYALGRLQGCQRRLSHMNTLLRLLPLPTWDVLGLTLAGH